MSPRILCLDQTVGYEIIKEGEKEEEKKVLTKGTEAVLYLEKAKRKIRMTYSSAVIRQRFREGKMPELREKKLLSYSPFYWPKEDVSEYVTLQARFRIMMRNSPFQQTVLATT